MLRSADVALQHRCQDRGEKRPQKTLIGYKFGLAIRFQPACAPMNFSHQQLHIVPRNGSALRISRGGGEKKLRMIIDLSPILLDYLVRQQNFHRQVILSYPRRYQALSGPPFRRVQLPRRR